jgi:2-polyprenyl-6-hydroxyphenyl methylase/3-demethylubiquinone-9 3-methyltransferase
MTDDEDPDEPIARHAYAAFAERYDAFAPTKPYNALYERPATLSLLGDVKGLRVLDAGCGSGICSEILARRGATVHGVDVTPEMIELARRRCAGLAVELMLGDLNRPLHWLAEKSFDGILCALALDYVAPLDGAFRELFRVTRSGGWLVFSMGHPMRDWMDERTHGGHGYHETSRFGMHWSGFGEPRPYVECYRRPLAAILNPLAEAGWSIERIVEPVPREEIRAVNEKLYEELARTPAFICVRARRPD